MPVADRVLAWDAAADLYVVGSWLGRASPPAGRDAQPNLIELRRISTGAQLGLANCAREPGELSQGEAVCDFRAQFADKLKGHPGFERRGQRIEPGAFRITRVDEAGLRSTALMARAGRGAFHRVAWLDQQTATTPARVSWRVVEGERTGGDVVLALSRVARVGACGETTVTMLRLRTVDLDAPAATDRQRHLLAGLTSSSPLAAWRTAAEIAPLPPARVLTGMAVATEAGLPAVAARWWRETTAALPVEQIAPLVTALRDRPELGPALRLIDLPALPEVAAPTTPAPAQ